MSAVPSIACDADEPGMTTWIRFLRAHAAVTRRLEAELQGECDLSLAEYETLLQLDRAEDGQVRMSELADRVILSRSGLTRLIDRLELAGDVERRTCPSDARGSFAVITDSGRARLRTAAPIHVRGIREHFLSRIPSDELGSLGTTLARLDMADAAHATDVAACRPSPDVVAPAGGRG